MLEADVVHARGLVCQRLLVSADSAHQDAQVTLTFARPLCAMTFPPLLAAIALLVSAVPAAANSQAWQTSLAGDRLAPLGAVVWSPAPPPAAQLTVQADFTSVRQTIVGFGGAFTESAAFNFAGLTPGNKSAALRLLVGAPDDGGNGLTMGRVAINSPDFALSDYSYANVTGDYALNSFDHTLARDGMYVVPFVRAALAAAPRPLKLFATPWSPPAWMKVAFGGDIPRMDGSTLPGLEGACNASWALYFSYWFSAMESAHNLTFWGYTAQNEPTAINATGVQWDACGWTAPGMAVFVRDFLGPVMQRDHPEIRLLIFDHNNGECQRSIHRALRSCATRCTTRREADVAGCRAAASRLPPRPTPPRPPTQITWRSVSGSDGGCTGRRPIASPPPHSHVCSTARPPVTRPSRAGADVLYGDPYVSSIAWGTGAGSGAGRRAGRERACAL